MKEFLLLFRRDETADVAPLSPEQMQAMMKPWQDWIGSIAAQNKLVSAGNRLESDGKVIKSNKTVTNGPYADIKETIGGYTIVKAASLADAVALSDNCPILAAGGSVEVRAIIPMD